MSDCFDHMADAWDDCLFLASADGYAPAGSAPYMPRCRKCGKNGLRWILAGEKWTLIEGKSIHMCTLSTDDFSELA